MKPKLQFLLASTCSLLQACGGGGGSGVSSTPVPVTVPTQPTNQAVSRTTTIGVDLPPTPALRAGTYNAIGIVNKEAAAGNPQVVSDLRSGDLAITVEPATRTYTLVLAAGAAPNLSQPARLSYTITDPAYGHEYTVTTRYANGDVLTEARKGDLADQTGPVSNGSFQSGARLFSGTGKQYVSYGLWEVGSSSKGIDQVYFVYGDRTPPSAVPASGKATYDSREHFLEWNVIYYNLDDVDIKLTADFAARSILADFRLSYFNQAAQRYDAPRLSGTGSIGGTGTFAIPMTGVLNSGATTSDPVTGSIAGAFFGPDASQIGATFSLSHAGEPTITGAFVGQRTTP